MTGGGSFGLRSGSSGSLQQHLHTTLLPIHNPPPPSSSSSSSFINRRSLKMLKEKDKFLHWILKFAGRKKVGMLFLSSVSALVFLWVLYVGKGEDSRDGEQIQRVSSLGDNPSFSFPEFSSIYMKENLTKYNTSLLIHVLKGDEVKMVSKGFKSASPPGVFLGYSLPRGHPCLQFTLPPPPMDRKRTGPRPCPVCYLSVDEAVALMPKYPSPSPVLHNLTYIYQDNLSRSEFGGSEFGGYPSLKERNESFNIKESMVVHCGFVRGIRPGSYTGFNIDDDDLGEMAQCHGVVVASAIFGNYDIIQQPKNMSEAAKKNVCFYMFVDIETETYLRSYGILGGNKMIGIWRIVVVHNLPYADARRNGKVPKLLLHRIFPNVRYSLWIDGKLELVVDPYQILERFLWRKNSSFAISRHYRRFDVFQEAEANKAAGKYDNSSIDFQIDFYKREGLTPYSDSKLPIASDVPEGCVIVREHIPITNLFTCLWFNEVDRFTSRDQISFSTVRDKITTKLNWNINMFLDCERRNFVVQVYHRDVLEHMPAPRPRPVSPSREPPPLPPLSPLLVMAKTSRKVQPKRGKERRKHRKIIPGGNKTSSSSSKDIII